LLIAYSKTYSLGIEPSLISWLSAACTTTVGENGYQFPLRDWQTQVQPLQDAEMNPNPTCEQIRDAMTPSTTGDCDYSNADAYGGYGWNATTNESCPPLDNDTGSCDYTYADEYGGYGWNETTGESCPPLDVQSDVPEKFAVDPYGIFTYTINGAFLDGDPWSDYGLRDSYTWGGHDENIRQGGLGGLNALFNGSTQMNDTQTRYFAERTGYDVTKSSNLRNDQNVYNYGRQNVEGQFRIHCGVSHFQKVDPITNPGTESGHLHMFWGNTETDENSHVYGDGSFESNIAENGQSNCQGGPYNRSAYWMPALLDKSTGVDEVVIPNSVFIYYKAMVRTALPDGSIEKVNALPMGIELLGGNMNFPGDSPANPWSGTLTAAEWESFSNALVDPGGSSRHDVDFVNWSCYSGEGIGHKTLDYIPSSEECRKHTHPDQPAWSGCGESHTYVNGVRTCPRNNKLEAQIRFPQCLALEKDENGNPIPGSPALNTDKYDDDNHVSHMYARMSWNAKHHYFCPESHPYRIPQITYRVSFHIPGSEHWGDRLREDEATAAAAGVVFGEDTLKDFRLSSDDHFHDVPTVTKSVGGEMVLDPKKRGWSLHGDWLGAWNEEIAKHWIDGCFDQQNDSGSPTGANRDGKNCSQQMGNPEGSPLEFGLRHFVGTHLKDASMKYDGAKFNYDYNRPLE